MSVYAGPEITDSGLILSIDAGNTKSYPGTGTIVYDLSSAKSNVTVYQATYANGYFEFDGVDDNLSINDLATTAPQIRSITTVFSEEVVFYPLSTGGDDAAALIRSGLGIDLNFSFFFNRPNRQIYFHWYDTTFQASFGTTNTVTLDKWNVGTIVRNGSSVSFYINGNLLNTNTGISSPTQVPTSMGIGATRSGTGVGTTGQDLAGRIASVRIYNTVLTDAQVKQNFNAIRGRFGI